MKVYLFHSFGRIYLRGEESETLCMLFNRYNDGSLTSKLYLNEANRTFPFMTEGRRIIIRDSGNTDTSLRICRNKPR